MALTADQVKTFIDGFKYSTAINGDVERKYLAHYVDVSDEPGTPKWELLGYKVTDASVEFNWESETVTDITGVTYNSITKSEPQMSLDGYIINSKSTFLDKLAKLAIRNAFTEFNNFTVLTVYYWLEKTSTYLAKKETDCSILPESIGGEGTLGITPQITFSNNATFGSVANSVTGNAGEITFTEGSIE